MPVFTSCAGFQIHDGNFYDVAGDVILQTHQQLISQDHPQSHVAATRNLAGPGPHASQLQIGWTERSRRETSGAGRSLRRIAPYDASHRTRVLLDGSTNVAQHTGSFPPLSSGHYNLEPQSIPRPVIPSTGLFRPLNHYAIPSSDPPSQYDQPALAGQHNSSLPITLSHPPTQYPLDFCSDFQEDKHNLPGATWSSNPLLYSRHYGHNLPDQHIFSDANSSADTPSQYSLDYDHTITDQHIFPHATSSFNPSSNYSLDSHPKTQADHQDFVTEPSQNTSSFHRHDEPPYSVPDDEPSLDIAGYLAPYSDCVGADPGPSIHGGTFITAQNINNGYRQEEIGISTLHRAAALEALHDSADSFPQPKCHPETREKMLGKLWEFATGSEPREKILWLHGPAGAGKSAIMWSLCERLEAAGRLGGAFFFKRGHPTRGNAKALFSTLAYRLALRVPWLKGPIFQAVENDPSLVSSAPCIQFQELILRPCQSSTSQAPAIILIDGLDECEGHKMQQEILRIVGNAFPQYHRFLRILIASRPEARISETIAGTFEALDVEQSFEDVRKYLVDEFIRIHHAHPSTMANIPSPWPSRDEIEILVRRSSGHFIYASTVIKFIDDSHFRPPQRLAAIIENRDTSESASPFGALDQLYTQILESVPKNKHLLNILRVIAHFSHLSTRHIDQLLELAAGDTPLALRGLHSLLKWYRNIDGDSVDIYRDLSWQHASFGDFLRNPARAGKFYIGGLAPCMDLARFILKALSEVRCREHVAWEISWQWMGYVVSIIPPSDELLPLFRLINPMFMYLHHGASDTEDKREIIIWSQQIHPVPLDLILLWEDHIFMAHFYAVLNTMINIESYSPRGSGTLSIQECNDAFSKSPMLLSVFHVIDVLSSPAFFIIRSVLDMSCADLRTSICVLRDITVENDKKLVLLFFWMRDQARHYDWAMEQLAMAHRCIQLLNDAASGQVNPALWNWFLPSWGILIRTSTPCLGLLQEIRGLLPALDLDLLPPIDIHNIVEWLKTFSEPPLDVIHCLENYFMEVYRDEDRPGSWRMRYGSFFYKFKGQIETQNKKYSFSDSFDSIPHLRWVLKEEDKKQRHESDKGEENDGESS